MSAAAALARAASAKHSLPDGQRRAPGHSSAVTLTLDHAGVEGSNSSSALSPLLVDSAQAARRRTSSRIRRAVTTRAEPLGRASGQVSGTSEPNASTSGDRSLAESGTSSRCWSEKRASSWSRCLQT